MRNTASAILLSLVLVAVGGCSTDDDTTAPAAPEGLRVGPVHSAPAAGGTQHVRTWVRAADAPTTTLDISDVTVGTQSVDPEAVAVEPVTSAAALVVVDRSAATERPGRHELIDTALAAVAAAVDRRQTLLGVMSFAEQPTLEHALGVRRSLLTERQLDLEPGGPRCTWDAVAAGVDTLADSDLAARSLVLVTTGPGGDAACGMADGTAAIEAARGASVPVHVLHVDARPTDDEAPLAVLAAETGGGYWTAHTAAGLTSTAQAVAGQLTAGAVLSFRAPLAQGTHTLTVRAEPHRKPSDGPDATAGDDAAATPDTPPGGQATLVVDRAPDRAAAAGAAADGLAAERDGDGGTAEGANGAAADSRASSADSEAAAAAAAPDSAAQDTAAAQPKAAGATTSRGPLLAMAALLVAGTGLAVYVGRKRLGQLVPADLPALATAAAPSTTSSDDTSTGATLVARAQAAGAALGKRAQYAVGRLRQAPSDAAPAPSAQPAERADATEDSDVTAVDLDPGTAELVAADAAAAPAVAEQPDAPTAGRNGAASHGPGTADEPTPTTADGGLRARAAALLTQLRPDAANGTAATTLETSDEATVAAAEDAAADTTADGYEEADTADIAAADDRAAALGPAPYALVGTVLGKYRLEAPLGRGGLGEVYRARDLSLERPVAVKVLAGQQYAKSSDIDAMRREARLAARLNHPNVVVIHDIISSEGRAAIVMEYVEGRTVAERVEEDGPMSPEAFVPVLEGVAAALDAAHRQGIVHGDVKPGNVLVTPDDHVKLLDFGIARQLHDPSSGKRFGTPPFVAPEVLDGREPEPQADVYSLGALAVAALTGQPGAPLERVPDPYVGAVKAALEPDPDMRCTTAGTLAVAFSLVAEHERTKRRSRWRQLLDGLRDRLSRDSAEPEALELSSEELDALESSAADGLIDPKRYRTRSLDELQPSESDTAERTAEPATDATDGPPSDSAREAAGTAAHQPNAAAGATSSEADTPPAGAEARDARRAAWRTFWTEPRATLQRLAAIDPAYGVPALAALTGTVVVLDGAAAMSLGQYYPSLGSVLLRVVLLGPAYGLAWLWLYGRTLHWVGHRLGGEAELSHARLVTAWSALPYLAFAGLPLVTRVLARGHGAFTVPPADPSTVATAATAVTVLLALVATGWWIVAHVKGVSELFGLSARRAVAASAAAALLAGMAFVPVVAVLLSGLLLAEATL